MAQLTLSNGTQVDPQSLDSNPPDASVLKVVQTIKGLETGGDYNDRSGDHGSSAGAYQWNNDNKPLRPGEMPSHWKNAAAQFLKDANAPMTPENQNYVAYQQIKAYKDQGRDPEEIDALWNGAHKDATTGKYVHNSTDRQAKFRAAILGGQQPANQPDANGYMTTSSPAPTTDQTQLGGVQPQDPESLGAQVAQRGVDLGNSLGDAASGAAGVLSGKDMLANTGKAASGVLQAGGAIGGLIGDVTNKAIEQIPGVKSLEGILGTALGGYLSTDSGKSMVKGLQSFAQSNPTLAKNMTAGFNIATAIPILKGVGTIGKLGLDVASSALKGSAEKVVTQGLSDIVGSSKTGAKSLAKNPDAIKTLISERAIPDIVDGKYTTKDAFDKLNQSISDVDTNELQKELQKANLSGIDSRIPLQQYQDMAVSNAKDELMSTKGVEDMFKLIQEKYGDYPTLEQMNDAKRTVSKRITDAAFGSPEASSNKLVRSALQQSVEDGAKALGLSDVAAINQKMARLIKAQDMLSYIDGKKVRLGSLGSIFQTGATAAGAAGGAAVGFSPETAAYVANKGGGFVGRKFAAVPNGILNRTGKDAIRTTGREVYDKSKGLIFNALQQKAQKKLDKLSNPTN